MRSFTIVRCVGFLMWCAIIAIAHAQPATDAVALTQKYPALARPDAMKSASFYVDPQISRTTASDTIEADLLVAQANVVHFVAQLAGARQIAAAAEASVSVAETKLFEASVILQKTTQFQRQLPGVMTDMTAAEQLDLLTKTEKELKQAKKTKTAAEEALAKARRDLDKAEAAVEASNQALDTARGKESKVLQTQKDWLATTIQKEPIKAGAYLQRDTIVIRFRPTTTIEQIDDLLKKYKLETRSGIASIALFITEFKDESDESPADRVRNTIQQIKNEDGHLVFNVYPNTVLGGTVLPRRNVGVLAPLCYEWSSQCSGTAAAMAMKFPAAWNLVPAITRRQTRVKVAVIDEGFSKHRDLPLTFFADPTCLDIARDHGNHVAGIIGADFDNQVGVDGGSPFTDILVCAPHQPDTAPTGVSAKIAAKPLPFTAVALAFAAIAEAQPKIVNVSLGYNWVRDIGLAALPETHDDVRQIVADQGATIRALVAQHPDIIVVSAAGNDCGENVVCDRNAQWTSPFNWAALADRGEDDLDKRDNIFVVQANKSDDPTQRWVSSNVGGTIAAPGEHIVSTVGHDGYNSFDGTSMAAPQITALLSLMLAFEPHLTVSRIREILNVGEARVPNAVAALRQSNQDQFERDVADMNADGRLDQEDIEIFEKDFADYTAHLQSGAFERDLNHDGQSDSNDALFPRCDLNGDGLVTKVGTEEGAPRGDFDILDRVINVPAGETVPLATVATGPLTKPSHDRH